MIDFQKLRKEYEDTGIVMEALGDCPIVAFQNWLKLAVDQSPGAWLEPNAMTLATADTTGRVTARTVLLKSVADDRFHFFSNYESEKARQLAKNPNACLLFHWPHLDRQVRIDGVVNKTSRSVSESYFHSRPRNAQIGGVVSQQSRVLASREELEQKVIALEEQYRDQPIPLPDHWGGYALTPNRIEFWQGRSSRLHDRIVYASTPEGSWDVVRLSP